MDKLQAFSKLQNHFLAINKLQLKDLFQETPNRANDLSLNLDSLHLDISKNHITKDTINLFVELAKESKLSDAINDMFTGKPINFTENRAVLHTALRTPKLQSLIVNNHDYAKDINAEFNKMCDFTNKVHNGKITTYKNEKFEHVVNIGIGGSYLGCAMAYSALQSQSSSNIKVHFVSNVDSSNLQHILDMVDIDKTLFIVASKTFTTQETMINAKTAKSIVEQTLGKEAITKHFVALSTNIPATTDFGINPEYTFGFWDFIGGRYSIWSAIGLPLMLKVGVDKFKEFLHGSNIVDEHFKTTPLHENIPFLLAIIGIWYNNFYNYNSYAILGYDYRLRDFTRYIQQLEMESNGKYINKQGEIVKYNTSPVVFGEPGTDSQHSFFQMIHQGTSIIPCDFIGFCNTSSNSNTNVTTKELSKLAHDALISNMFAQTESLMMGKNASQVEEELQKQNLTPEEIKNLTPHKIFVGNRPSNTFLFKELSPKTLGMLCAIYEHKIFVQGIIWQINSFDQWGVELGKQLANNILDSISNKTPYKGSSSSLSLIQKYKDWGN